jgi:protein involved in sex pheromone biosynthesis
MKKRILGCIAIVLALAGCGPKIEANRAVAGRVVTIRNIDDHSFTLRRVVANNNDSDSNCVDNPTTTLAPGESYTTTFMVCGSVASLSVETSEGSVSLQW